MSIDEAALRQLYTEWEPWAGLHADELQLIKAVPTLLDDFVTLRAALEQAERERDAVRAENERLQAAIMHYGEHQPPCRHRPYGNTPSPCTCGLWDIQYPGWQNRKYPVLSPPATQEE